MWDHSLDTQINIKKITFFPPTLRMRGKKINFEDKEIKKNDFYKNKKIFTRDEIGVDIKHQFLKTNHMVQISQLNISLDIMMMMPLEHYV